MEGQALLEVNELTVRFAGEGQTITAVDRIAFRLAKGETLGIVGESGSGKSVTALSIMRLLPSAVLGGSVRFRADEGSPPNLLTLPEPEMSRLRGKRLAMIFQEPMTALNPVMRCGEQISEAIVQNLGLDDWQARARTMEWIDKVHLADPERIYRAYPHELSGGQKQRVLIAMALSGNPDILIADEPTTALDVTVQRSILELINELKTTWNGSIIFISHDLGVIADVADRVLVMRKGEIVEEGPVEALFRNPAHPYTKGLLACRPPLNYRLRRLPVLDDFIGEDGKPHAGERVPGAFPDQNLVPEKEVAERLERLLGQAPLLEVEQLSTWFPASRNLYGKPVRFVKAVDGVSFDIFPGETLGLVGESGCGKTTLGRSILHLIRPTAGRVRYRGKDLSDSSPREWKALRKELQIIFQDPYAALNPRQPVGEAVLEPMRVHGMYSDEEASREAMLELFRMVSLDPDLHRRYPHEFSGGQRQRICIARALAVRPKFLICDESVSSLDVSVQAQILNLLLDLRDQLELTLLFISHDLSVVKMMSDRIMVMHQGKIAEIGPAEEVFHRPQSPYTRHLIEAIPKGEF